MAIKTCAIEYPEMESLKLIMTALEAEHEEETGKKASFEFMISQIEKIMNHAIEAGVIRVNKKRGKIILKKEFSWLRYLVLANFGPEEQGLVSVFEVGKICMDNEE